MKRRISFLDEAIQKAKADERQRLAEIVKNLGESWEVIVIQELLDILEESK